MIDARGLACPQPVVLVQKAVKSGAPATLAVQVDDRCAVENITRFAANQGYAVSVQETGDEEYTLTLTKRS